MDFTFNDDHLDLQEAVRAFAEAELRLVLRCAAAALAHVHSRGMCHLDVKPDNIYAHEGSWVLGDFGMAARRGVPGRTGDPPAHRAPTKRRGEG